ncbi:hypothetical protein ABZ504_54910, partial [Streptomyces mirabilis]
MGGDAVPPRPKYLPSGATWRPRPAEPPVGGEPWSQPSPQEPPAATVPGPRRTDMLIDNVQERAGLGLLEPVLRDRADGIADHVVF